jgi:hypothetical protein
MMIDPVLTAFLTQQHRHAMELARQSSIIDIVPVEGSPPNRYMVDFKARGLVRERNGEIGYRDRCSMLLWFPDCYVNPDWDEVPLPILTYVGPHPVPWHPNISIRSDRPNFVCVHVKPSTPLVSLLRAAYDIWRWKLVYTGDDGLNPEASAWARNQERSRFPVDRRQLVDRARAPRMTVKMKQAAPVEADRPRAGKEET